MTEAIISAYKGFLPCDWNPTDAQIKTLDDLCCFASDRNYPIRTDYESVLIEAVNQKLALNNDVYKHILDVAFFERVKLNYILKTKIKSYLDSCDLTGYRELLIANSISTERLINSFTPVPQNDTLAALRGLYTNDKQYQDVYCSIFSRFCFNLFDKQCTSEFFSGSTDLSDDYFSFITNKYPDIAERDHALGIIDVSSGLFCSSYEEGCNTILNAIKQSFTILNNHCELGIYIPQFEKQQEGIQWKLYADIVLFAEKFIKEKIDKAYFRWKKIASKTCDYIDRIVPYNAEFEYAFQGFVFKDCFILEQNNGKYDLLLVFEKNVRDERIVNCPACRSENIQGNSYPILNVRSWECENPLCPDRSKYNRGKRYAFMSLFRQREMMNDDNIIPDSSISKWHLDCLKDTSKEEAIEMLIRHYSCTGDGIFIYSESGNAIENTFGRTISHYPFEKPQLDLLSDFKNSTYFYRYIHTNYREPQPVEEWSIGKVKVVYGDALDSLRSMESNTLSGVVTSPPYYNAKSYSQWPNIYCYLYDMYNIFAEVYRTMKDGGVVLFNIFDYFDNENNIVLSAMGNKRMILGAYMIDIFERIGFTVCGNIIWNKGEIQGNRSFNQGNLTPYYQAPLNCWEHILILSKGEKSKKFDSIESSVENIRPVIKMIHGKNVLGHDAPYPQEIPELLIKSMDKDDIVLDPFLGSGTTSIVAYRHGIHSVGIEKSEDYYHLCQEKIKQSTVFQLSFDQIGIN